MQQLNTYLGEERMALNSVDVVGRVLHAGGSALSAYLRSAPRSPVK